MGGWRTRGERSLAWLTRESRAARPNDGRANMGLIVSLELGIGCNRIPACGDVYRAVLHCWSGIGGLNRAALSCWSSTPRGSSPHPKQRLAHTRPNRVAPLGDKVPRGGDMVLCTSTVVDCVRA